MVMYKQTLKLLVILHLALFNILSIVLADQNNFIPWTAHIIQMTCAAWGLPDKLDIYKVFMFILHRKRYTFHKVSS